MFKSALDLFCLGVSCVLGGLSLTRGTVSCLYTLVALFVDFKSH